MPRGRQVNHKGRRRHFTSPEELEQQRKRIENGEDEEEEVEESSDDEESGSDESGSGTDDENQKAKGVQGLIEIENPNRAVKKAAQKVTTASLEVTPELSRSDQKQLEKQRAREHYQKLHAEGKTKQARADLARLAIIKQHRAEAAARREADKKDKQPRAQPSGTTE